MIHTLLRKFFCRTFVQPRRSWSSFAVAILEFGVSILTKILPFAAAFFFAKGFIKPSLGNRVACQFVSLFRSSSLGLGYSLVFSKALLTPAIPSVSARLVEFSCHS
ncbi:hypothetical protein HN51_001873 [Arachis hypogaea]